MYSDVIFCFTNSSNNLYILYEYLFIFKDFYGDTIFFLPTIRVLLDI